MRAFCTDIAGKGHNDIFAQFPDRICTSPEKDEQNRITIGAALYAQTSTHKVIRGRAKPNREYGESLRFSFARKRAQTPAGETLVLTAKATSKYGYSACAKLQRNP